MSSGAISYVDKLTGQKKTLDMAALPPLGSQRSFPLPSMQSEMPASAEPYSSPTAQGWWDKTTRTAVLKGGDPVDFLDTLPDAAPTPDPVDFLDNLPDAETSWWDKGKDALVNTAITIGTPIIKGAESLAQTAGTISVPAQIAIDKQTKGTADFGRAIGAPIERIGTAVGGIMQAGAEHPIETGFIAGGVPGALGSFARERIGEWAGMSAEEQHKSSVEMANYISDFWTKQADETTANIAPETRAPMSWESAKNPAWWANKVGELIGGFAPVLTGPAAPYIFGAQAYGNTYDKLRNENVNPEEAAVRSSVIGAVNIGLMKFGIDKVFKGVNKTVLGRAITNYLTTVGVLTGLSSSQVLSEEFAREGIPLPKMAEDVLVAAGDTLKDPATHLLAAAAVTHAPGQVRQARAQESLKQLQERHAQELEAAKIRDAAIAAEQQLRETTPPELPFQKTSSQPEEQLYQPEAIGAVDEGGLPARGAQQDVGDGTSKVQLGEKPVEPVRPVMAETEPSAEALEFPPREKLTAKEKTKRAVREKKTAESEAQELQSGKTLGEVRDELKRRGLEGELNGLIDRLEKAKLEAAAGNFGKAPAKDREGYITSWVNQGRVYPEGFNKDSIKALQKFKDGDKPLTTNEADLVDKALKLIDSETFREMPKESDKAANLKVGESVEVDGDPHKVIANTPDGVILKDGKPVTFKPTDTIVFDEGSRKGKPVKPPSSELLGDQTPFNLAGQQASDGARIVAEQAKAKADKAASEAAQPDMFEKGPGDMSGPGSPKVRTPKAEPDVPETENTATKNAYTKRMQDILGLTTETPEGKQSMDDIAEAATRVQRNPNVANDLMKELNADPRPTRGWERIVLLDEAKKAEELLNTIHTEGNKLAKSGNTAAIEENAMEAKQALQRIQDVYTISQSASYEWGRAGKAMQVIADEGFTLGRMTIEHMALQKGKPLSEGLKSDLERIQSEYAGKKKVYEEHIKRLETEAEAKDKIISASKSNAIIDEMMKEILNEKEVPQRNWAKKATDRFDQMAKEATDFLSQTHLKMGAGPDPMIVVNLAKLGAAHIGKLSVKGAVKFAEWSAKMNESMKGWNIKADLQDVWNKARALVRAVAQTDVVESLRERKKSEPSVGGTSEKDIRALVKQEVEDFLQKRPEGDKSRPNLNTIIKNVHSVLREIDPNMTENEIRDIFAGRGKAYPANRTEAEKVIADLHGQSQLLINIELVLKAIEQESKVNPTERFGPQREKPSQKMRDLRKDLNRLMKQADLETIDTAKQQASSLEAIKSRLRNQIEDLDKAIKSGQERVTDKNVTIYDAEAKSLKEHRDVLQEQYDKMFPEKPLTEDQRLNISIKAAERTLSDLKTRLVEAHNGVMNKEVVKAQPWSKRLSELKNEQKVAREELQTLKDLANPKKSPEQTAIDAKRKRIESATKELERRMRDKDFTKKERKEINISEDMDALRAQAELEKTRIKYADMKEETRRANRTFAEALSENTQEMAWETANFTKNVMSSWDLSAPGRQGYFYGLAHPIEWLKSFKPMVQSLSREKSMQIHARLQERENFKKGYYKTAGLGISKGDGTGEFTQVEDSHRLDLANKIPGIGASNRAYATFLNEIRADMFDRLLKNSGDPTDVSPKKLKAIADGVNVLTGRGDVGTHAEGLATFLWAPRFIKGTVETLIGHPMWNLRNGTPETRKMFAKEYARAATTLGVIYGVYLLFKRKHDKNIDIDPTSSNFGAIPIGKEHYWDVLAPVRVQLTAAARMAGGAKAVLSGQEMKKKFGDEGPLADWLKGKQHPAFGIAQGLFTGYFPYEDKPISKMSVREKISHVAGPLSVTQISQNRGGEDTDAGIVFSLMNLLGFGIKPDYAKAKKRIAQETAKKENEKALLKLRIRQAKGLK